MVEHTMLRHTVLGQDVTLPVRIRDATACTALFAVPAGAAQGLVDYSGLRVTQPVPGRALCSLAFIRYVDGDLGPYHEFAVGFAVGPRRASGMFVHWLPVNQEFTLAAGRAIWGFPKELADIELDLSGPVRRCLVRHQGEPVIELVLRPGLPLPTPQAVTRTRVDSYTYRDGILRRIQSTLNAHGTRVRPGGAWMRLGRHRIADELRRLGLPRRAVLSTTVQHVSAVIQAAEEVTP